jgi:hypothetical protein
VVTHVYDLALGTDTNMGALIGICRLAIVGASALLFGPQGSILLWGKIIWKQLYIDPLKFSTMIGAYYRML